jgi:hypothetical protein
VRRLNTVVKWLWFAKPTAAATYHYRSDDALIEGRKIFRRDPVLRVDRATHLLELIAIQEVRTDGESRYIPNATGLHIPVSRYLRSDCLPSNRLSGPF